MVMNTVINVKTDKHLKTEAQKLSKSFGLPLSTVINAYLREFVKERRIVFSESPLLNSRTQKILEEALKDVKAGKNLYGPFETSTEIDRFLDSVKK
jgi:addiction module RelB/DinJ family antitoxin